MMSRETPATAFANLAARLAAVPPDDDAGIALCAALVSEAAALRISDIHLWPEEAGYGVAVRRDGLLYRFATLPLQSGRLLLGRVRVQCRMPGSDDALPHDGSFSQELKLPGGLARSQAVRASFFPVLRGVRLVLRLPEHGIPPGIAELGLPPDLVGRLRRLVAQRQGLLLATGPAGSGKTTTLYALLREVADRPGAPNIMTLEDPVERELPVAMQTNIVPEQGFDYAEAIRSVLRQDPDVIMMGEIRDPESARMAARLALTGHLMLSTLHTAFARSVPARLEELGVPTHLWGPTLLGVLAQRLVPRLCPSCRPPAPAGCPACDHTGYLGRCPIAELWLPGEAPAEGQLIPPGGLDESARILASEEKIRIEDWLVSS